MKTIHIRYESHYKPTGAEGKEFHVQGLIREVPILGRQQDLPQRIFLLHVTYLRVHLGDGFLDMPTNGFKFLTDNSGDWEIGDVHEKMFIPHSSEFNNWLKGIVLNHLNHDKNINK